MSKLSRHLRRPLAPALVLCLWASTAAAAPMSFSRSLGFSASQGMWGPGGSRAAFGASDSASVDPPFLPEVGAGYSFSADTGTAWANVNGTLSASYDDTLSRRGTTSIGVDFDLGSSSFGSDLGANASITGFVHDVPFYGPWNFCFYCADWDLNPSRTYTPSWGSWASTTDSFPLAGVGPDIGVAAAQITFNGNQTTWFRPDQFVGNLQYTHRDTGFTRNAGFSLTDLSFLDVDLDLPGIWDFTFTGLDFVGRFDTSIGGNLSADVEVFGLFDESFPFGNFTLFSVTSFPLNFGSLSPVSAFSVTVPEAGPGLLALAGLLGLAALGRRPAQA